MKYLLMLIIASTSFVYPGLVFADGCAQTSIHKIYTVSISMVPGIDEVLKGRRASFTDAKIAWSDRSGVAINFRGDVEMVKATCSMSDENATEAVVVMQKFVKKRTVVSGARELIGRLGEDFFQFDRATTEDAVNKCVNMTKSGFNKPEGDLVRVGNVSCVVRALEDDGEGGGRGYDISLCVGACNVTVGFMPR